VDGMDKIAIQGFTSAYTRHIGRKPWLEAGVLGTGGALAGYHGMNFIVPALLKALMVGKSPEERRSMLDAFKSDGTLRLLKNLGAGIGGVAGVGYAAQKHMDWGGGLEGALGSMKDSRYWNTPEGRAVSKVVSKNKFKARQRLNIEKSEGYSSGRTQKVAFSGNYTDPLFNSERIPVSYSLNLINSDPFLTLGEKEITGMVLEGAEGGNSGLVSSRDVARSAIQAGVGGGVGILFGKTVGALLSLPPPVTRRLSVVGAIAGALTNTGLFSEIRQ
jgi:hypothetical protein